MQWLRLFPVATAKELCTGVDTIILSILLSLLGSGTLSLPSNKIAVFKSSSRHAVRGLLLSQIYAGVVFGSI